MHPTLRSSQEPAKFIESLKGKVATIFKVTFDV